jgi:hypothetical protein
VRFDMDCRRTNLGVEVCGGNGRLLSWVEKCLTDSRRLKMS